MKHTKIAVAVAAMTFAGSASAFAPGTAHSLNLYLSGASAQDKSIAALVEGLCTTDATGAPIFDKFVNSGKTKYTAWSCTLDHLKVGAATVNGATSAGMLADRTVLIQKRSKGGSGIGVDPVANSKLVDFMPITAANCPVDVPGGHTYTCTTASGDLQVPSFGVSDVNPAMFVGKNTPAGFTAVAAADVAKLDVTSAAALVFGVPVTTELRDALQVAQVSQGILPVGCDAGLDGAPIKDATGKIIGRTAPTRETEACMPTLSSNQVASIMSGKIKTWNQFYINGTALPSVAGVTVPGGTITAGDLKVQICRRVEGSGTQAQNNMVFLRYPCTSAAAFPAVPSRAGNRNGPVVYLNSGSGDVNKCLDDFNNGSNTGKKSDGTFNNAGLIHRWAIGLQALEKNANLKFGYRFVKVDGAAPTLVNAANGTYKDWVEQTYQWRKTLGTAADSDLTGQDVDAKNIVYAIAAKAATPAFLGALDASKFDHTFGRSGFLAAATHFTPSATGQLDLLNPVMPYTHAPAGSALDNCRIPMVAGNSSLN